MVRFFGEMAFELLSAIAWIILGILGIFLLRGQAHAEPVRYGFDCCQHASCDEPFGVGTRQTDAAYQSDFASGRLPALASEDLVNQAQ